MNNLREQNKLSSMIYVLVAYLTWSLFPLYWKLFDFVPATEVLAHRIIWSLVYVILMTFFLRKTALVLQELTALFKNRRQLLAISTASVLISLNWFTYIWAVNHGHLLQTSLGYYINPLLSVLLGVIILKERLSIWQNISFILAAIGVVSYATYIGSFPWIAITLAVTFAIYGLIKKTTNLSALTSLFIETLLITPFALLYASTLFISGEGYFALNGLTTSLLLIGGGFLTAIPLLLFGVGAKGIPLTLLGFLQYFTPTITFLLGVFVFREPFTNTHLISFIFIWSALAIFSLSEIRAILQVNKMNMHKKHVS